MALPSSGQISFADLQAEFGGSNPISLSEFRASNHNSARTSGGPNYRIADVSKNTVNNKLQLNGNDVDFININTDSKLVLVLESGVWNDGNLYFSTTTTPGNNNLLNTGVTNNGAGVGSIMVIDAQDSSPTFTLVDLNTYGNVGGMPDNTWTVNYMDSTFAGSTMTAIYLKSAALFSTATGTFNNGTDTLHILNADGSVFLSIDTTVDSLIVTNGQAVFYTMNMGDFAALSGSASYNTANAAATTVDEHKEALFNYIHPIHPKSSWPVNTLKVNTSLPFQHNTNGLVNGYLKSDTTTASTAVEIQIVTDPGNTATAVDYLYGKARFSFSDAGSFVGGSVNTKITSTSNILDSENGVIVPNGQKVEFSQVMTALPTIWAGGTWHYYYLNLYDASWDASTKVFTFDNFRNVAWTNNTGYTNGSGTFLNSSNNNATNVANYVASSAGYNVARAPNYAGTSENVTLKMTNSGATLNHEFTNNTGGYVLLYKYTMSNSSGFPAGSNNRLGSLLWADSAGNFTNAHTVNGTGCFETFSRQNFGFPTWLRITFYFTPVGSGTETQIGFYNYIFDDGTSQTDALNKIKTDTEAYFHDALDTSEDYPFLYCDVNADSVDFRYYLPGVLRIVPEYYRYGYNQGGAGGVPHTSTAASAIQGHLNYNFANFKSNELTTAANGNQNIKRQTQNMSLSDYYSGRGSLTLGSG